LFRRLTARFRRTKKEEAKTEESRPDTSVVAAESSVEVSSSESIVSPPAVEEKTGEMSHPLPEGTLVASTAELRVDAEATRSMAEKAQIKPHRVREIVAGEDLKRDEEGRIHIKIVFYGPSLSGKTTALRWLFANVRSLSKGKIVEISDELGRTTYFDFIPVSASDKVVFDVFTVAGQRRHATQRINVLRGVDGIIYMADSTPEQMNENLASIQELRIALGTDRMATLPIIISLNKRDLPNALPVDYMVQMLDVQGHPVFPTIATEGKNLLRMFQRVLRDSLIFKVGV
jgi:signal recognition particle receptor subunit beta